MKFRLDKTYLLCAGLLMVAALVSFALLHDGNTQDNSPTVESTTRPSTSPIEQISQLETISSPFQGSLETRENTEFLLSPALLIQDAISNDLILYPNE